jgi:uncharacterized protein (TIGR00661 family)
MKVLYAIQATGNGHISRARDIIPVLQQKCELDILISGTQAQVILPHEIKYRYKGMSLLYNKKGGLDFIKTAGQANLKRFLLEVNDVPVENYDLVINDFEPVSAWACKKKKIPCVSLSHQAAVINKFSPKPAIKNILGALVLKYFAPCDESTGFHFQSYDSNIFTPVIRNEIRNSTPQIKEYYTVYLPAYSHEVLLRRLSKLKNVQWHIFSKDIKEELRIENFYIRPIKNEAFIESLVNCKGVLCGAGFELPAEALFLQKKLMVIPMQGQYEQQCNAAALKKMGVAVINKLNTRNLVLVNEWLASEHKNIRVEYPDITEEVIKTLLNKQIVKGRLSSAAGFEENILWQLKNPEESLRVTAR